MNYRDIKYTAFGRWCRRCINEEFGLELESKDCLYMNYPCTCARCQKMQNIVEDVAFLSRWKIWFKKKEE